jgi:hypothetical protein
MREAIAAAVPVVTVSDWPVIVTGIVIGVVGLAGIVAVYWQGKRAAEASSENLHRSIDETSMDAGEWRVTMVSAQVGRGLAAVGQAGLTAWMRSTVPAFSRSVSMTWNPAARTRGSWRRVKCSPAARMVICSRSHWAA